MQDLDFYRLCGHALYDEDSKIVSNSQSTTKSVKMGEANDLEGKPLNRSEKGCVGTFTFVNGKLDTITR